jgi:hypothetical protein
MPQSGVAAGLLTETVVREGIVGGALFDRGRRYRYRLSRTWDETLSGVCWIMLNPSTATASVDDQTIARVIGFSRSWGYGWATVVNLFAYRARDPATLSRVVDPVGPHNDEVIASASTSTSEVILAWGNHGDLVNPVTGQPRCEEVCRLLTSCGVTPRGLALTSRNQPGHPLYLPRSAKPVPPVGCYERE